MREYDPDRCSYVLGVVVIVAVLLILLVGCSTNEAGQLVIVDF